jgi:putative FmdB family regulatory protein
MPIFDFTCRSCGNQFEALVLKRPAVCPTCHGEDLEKMLSLPVVRSDGTKAKTMAEARKQENAVAAEKNHAQRLYEQSHND